MVFLCPVSSVVAYKHVSYRHAVEEVPDSYVAQGYHEVVQLVFVDLINQKWNLSEYFDKVCEKEDSELYEHFAPRLLALFKNRNPL